MWRFWFDWVYGQSTFEVSNQVGDKVGEVGAALLAARHGFGMLKNALEVEVGDLFGVGAAGVVVAGEGDEGVVGLGDGGEGGGELCDLAGASPMLEGVEVAFRGAGTFAAAAPGVFGFGGVGWVGWGGHGSRYFRGVGWGSLRGKWHGGCAQACKHGGVQGAPEAGGVITLRLAASQDADRQYSRSLRERDP